MKIHRYKYMFEWLLNTTGNDYNNNDDNECEDIYCFYFYKIGKHNLLVHYGGRIAHSNFVRHKGAFFYFFPLFCSFMRRRLLMLTLTLTLAKIELYYNLNL